MYWYYDGKLLRVYDTPDIAEVGIENSAEMVVLLQMGKHNSETWIGKPMPNDGKLQMRTDWVKVYALKK